MPITTDQIVIAIDQNCNIISISRFCLWKWESYWLYMFTKLRNQDHNHNFWTICWSQAHVTRSYNSPHSQALFFASGYFTNNSMRKGQYVWWKLTHFDPLLITLTKLSHLPVSHTISSFLASGYLQITQRMKGKYLWWKLTS